MLRIATGLCKLEAEILGSFGETGEGNEQTRAIASPGSVPGGRDSGEWVGSGTPVRTDSPYLLQTFIPTG